MCKQYINTFMCSELILLSYRFIPGCDVMNFYSMMSQFIGFRLSD